MNNFRLNALVILVLFSMCFSSCQGFPFFIRGDKHISVRVRNTGGPVLKSSLDTKTKEYDLGDGLVLEETASVFSDYEEEDTKGAIVTTSAYNKINAAGRQFHMEGWLAEEAVSAPTSTDADKTNRHFFSNLPQYDGVMWEMSTLEDWRSGIPTTFWSYFTPDGSTIPFSFGDNPTDSQLNSWTFNYSLPAADGVSDAGTLQDLLVAYNYEKRVLSESGTISKAEGSSTTLEKNDVSIHFYHPLAAVKFEMGTFGGSNVIGDNEYVEITKVEIVGVKTSGTFTAVGSGYNGCTISCSGQTGSATYGQEASRSDIENGKFSAANSDHIFFMIPQNVTGVKLRLSILKRKRNVVLDESGNVISSSWTEPIPYEREVALSGNWESGYYYKYKISCKTVYFGGESVTMESDKIDVSNSEKIIVSDDGFSFDISGSTAFNEWAAAIPTHDVNVLKITFTHSYTNNSQKSYRLVWLDSVVPNPDFVEGGTEHRYIDATPALDTRDSGLVAEALALDNAGRYWPNGYKGTLGDVNGYKATAMDNGMNDKGDYTNKESVMYFYLGGRFDYVKLHFEYNGSTGSGSIKWSAKLPTFNITEVVE